MIELNCTIERITFSNSETGYAVLYVSNDGKPKYLTIIIENAFCELRTGMNLHVFGEWVNSDRYGRQIKVSKWEERLPDTKEGIISYLSCGIFKGIGPVLAKKIVDTLGEETLTLISNHSPRILEVPKLGKKKAEAIWETWDKQQGVREAMIFLSNFGVGHKTAMKIYSKYTVNTIENVKNNPYQLIEDIDGIGFETADMIGRKLMFAWTHPSRLWFGIIYILTTWGEEGNTYMNYEDLVYTASDKLGVEDSFIRESLETMIGQERLIQRGSKIYESSLYYAEEFCANKLLSLLNDGHITRFTADIDKLQEELGIQYEEEQKDAIKKALGENVCVVTGGPGTGKTTTTRGIITALTENYLSIACCAPTGKAAEHMEEMTEMHAQTIHRLLEYNPKMGWIRCGDNPLTEDVIIVDEASMINVTLFQKLLDAIKVGSKLIIIGDEDQLPAIGAGNVLHDIIDSKVIPVVRFTRIFRQAQNSKIITAAHEINKGIAPVIKNSNDSDLFFKQELDENVINAEILSLVEKRLPKRYGVNPSDIQVITPMKKGVCGINNFNLQLQDALNPNGERCNFTFFRVGDKVMQIKNNYDFGVFNGDNGVVKCFDNVNKTMTVTFKTCEVEYHKEDLEELMLSYAITIHKSQGSEYPIIVMPITSSHYRMLNRNLIYTAITRAKKICVIVGEHHMFAHGVHTEDVKKRLTSLNEFLAESGDNVSRYYSI